MWFSNCVYILSKIINKILEFNYLHIATYMNKYCTKDTTHLNSPQVIVNDRLIVFCRTHVYMSNTNTSVLEGRQIMSDWRHRLVFELELHKIFHFIVCLLTCFEHAVKYNIWSEHFIRFKSMKQGLLHNNFNTFMLKYWLSCIDIQNCMYQFPCHVT